MSAITQQHRSTLAHGEVAWLEAGPPHAAAPTLVLLHGIGSCAASWRTQLAELSERWRVLAWDAPGYGGSAPLAQEQPRAADYAAAAAAWLRAAGVKHPVVVGHSLGALMGAALAAEAATSACSTTDLQARALLLVSPAQGYGYTSHDIREQRFNERIQSLATHGAQGMADKRGAILCAPHASALAVAEVRDHLARVSMPGYGQASWMLSNENIDTHLAKVKVPAAVLCGELDSITPPKGARALAQRHNLPYTELAGVGHACNIEDPTGFDVAVRAALQRLLQPELKEPI